jgi:hypothetical protein
LSVTITFTNRMFSNGIVTGWGQEHDHRCSRAAGFDHHLVKPPDIDKLRDLLTDR